MDSQHRNKAASPSLHENTDTPWSEGTTSSIRLLVFSSSLCQYSISSSQGGDTKLPRGNGLETSEILNIFNCIIQHAADIWSYGLSVDTYQLNPVVKTGCENRSALCVTQDEPCNKECHRDISNPSDQQQQCLANIKGDMMFLWK